MGFHGGLSSSIGLMMADPSLIPTTFPDFAREGIPLSLTIGSTANIVTTGSLLVVIPVVMGLLHPKAEIRELPRTTYREIDAVVTEAEGEDGRATAETEQPVATDGGFGTFPSRFGRAALSRELLEEYRRRTHSGNDRSVPRV